MAGLRQPARKVHGTEKIKTPNLESMLSPTLSFDSWENGGSERSRGWPVSKQALVPVNLVLFGGNSFHHPQIPTQGGRCLAKDWLEGTSLNSDSSLRQSCSHPEGH